MNPNTLFSRDFSDKKIFKRFFWQSLLEARFLYVLQLALATKLFLSQCKTAVFQLHIFIGATACSGDLFIGWVFAPQKFRFLESELLVQTLQDWSRTSRNLLESKDTKVYTEINCRRLYRSLHKWAFFTAKEQRQNIISSSFKILVSWLNFFQRFSLSSCLGVYQIWQWLHRCGLWLCLRLSLYFNTKTSTESNGFQQLIYQTSYSFKAKASPKEKTCLMTDCVFIWITAGIRTPGKNNPQKL